MNVNVLISTFTLCVFLCVSGMSQQPDGGFGGATTPQSPLMSPRMGHAQSPMMQQGNAPFQSSPDMNGWTQGNMNTNRYTHTHTRPRICLNWLESVVI